jgi:hypothetical protein
MPSQKQLTERVIERADGLLSTLEAAWGANQITAPRFVQCQLDTDAADLRKAIDALRAEQSAAMRRSSRGLIADMRALAEGRA